MDNTLVYIVRGLPQPFDTAVAQALTEFLKDRRQRPGREDPVELLHLLEGASRLMIARPEYDLSDFNQAEILKALNLLAANDEQLWAQLLHALDDMHSTEFEHLKRLSPFAGVFMMFLDAASETAQVRAELDDRLAEELLRRADAHNFPGNSYAVIVPLRALEMMRFVAASDDVPVTA